MDRNTLIDYMFCRTSPEQEEEVLNWLDASPENRKEMDGLNETFNAMVLHSECGGENPETGRKGRLRRLALRWTAAAAACAAAVFGGGWLFSSWRINRFADQTIALSSPSGQTVNVTLQDGTRVWLTGGSTIEYPVAFSRGERRVEVSGEAMFDVTRRDDRQPFVVGTFAGEVEVLGTKFDVIADKETGTFSTALLRGKVRVSDGEESVLLAPGQIAELKDGRIDVSEMGSVDDYLWIEGILVLNTPSFASLASKIEKIYDVKITLDGTSAPVVKTRGKIRTADGLEHAMRIILAGTGSTFEIDYDTKQVHIK